MAIVAVSLWLLLHRLWLKNYSTSSIVSLYNLTTIQRFQRRNETKMAHANCTGQSGLFDEFFNDSSTAAFMNEYKSQCRSGRLVFASILGDVRELGFGSYMNNAANAYVVTTEPANKDHWRFQFVVHDWDYEPLSSFFSDFSKDSACPLFAHPQDEEYSSLFGDVEEEFVENVDDSLTITATKSVKITPNSKEFHKLITGLDKLFAHNNTDAVFHKKSALIKAIWQPNKVFKELLKQLWICLVDSSNRFTAVHIRRSDKIATGEAKETPLSKYAEAVHDICRKDPFNCPQNVFVMADEVETYYEFKRHLWSSFKVYDFPDLLEKAGLDPGEYIIMRAEILKHILPPSHREFWGIHTREIVIGLTLMGLSDHLVCTFSSNMCRLAALLRGHPSRGIHSLDIRAWHPR